jgi:PAS domain S-box-containing protein
VAVGLALLLAFVVVVVAVATRYHERSVRREWFDRLVSIGSERESSILQYLEERTEDAEVFAAFPSVIRVAAGVGALPGNECHDHDHLEVVFEAGRRSWRCRTVALLGPGFDERLRSGEPVPAEVVARLREVAPTGSWVGYVRTESGGRLSFAAPVAAAPGGPPAAWIVLADDVERKLTGLLRRAPARTRSGDLILVLREGGGVLHLSPLRGREPDASPVDLATLAASDPARAAVEGREGFGEYVDDRGIRVLAAVRHVEGPGWGLVVKVDAEEALARLAWYRALSAATVLSIAFALFALVRWTRAEERLRASREQGRRDERHRSVLEQMRDAVIWVDPESGRILEANSAAVELWGYSREELFARTVFDLRPEEERDAGASTGESLRTSLTRFRIRHGRRDGSSVQVEVSSRLVSLDGEQVLVAVVRDVSENEAALSRIQLLNRLLRTINAVDQVLVEARDRGEALQKACEEIVAVGEFTVAWFGAPGEGDRLVPVAFAGRTEGFFEEVGFPLTDPPELRSPTVTAFLEGHPVVVDDWEADPRVAPCREAGLRRGYLSSASWPVRSGGAIQGVLALYSSEKAAFGPEAVLLLEDLASDLGLALDLFDAEERRRRAEASLARSEERYRKLFEHNPAPMWVFEIETLRFLAVNESATELYGYTREEFLARTLRDIRPPEDVARLEEDVRVPRSAIRRSGPWRHRRKGGAELLVEIVTHDVDFEGRPARLVLANDVTERLRAEEKLRAFFDSGMAGAIFGDVHGSVIAANDEFLRIVGFTRGDLEEGRLRWIDITPPEWLPVDAAGIAEAKGRGVCTPYEKEYVRKDGSRVPVLVGYALVGEEREESVAFILDLTTRKEAEARLGATTRLLQAIVDGSPAPILTLDREGTVTSWNPAAEAVFGWSADEAIGRTLPIVPADREAEFLSFLSDVREGCAFAGREVRRRRKDGSLLDVSIAAAPLKDGAGAVTGVAAVLVDVSARVKAEEEVRSLNAELEERVERRTAELVAKSKELESFAYSISHDLRAPLRAIDGFSRLLGEEHAGRLDGEGLRLLGVVRENALRMGRLIDDLLTFSRAGRHELRTKRVDAGELVRSVLGEVLPETERGQSEVRVGDLPPVAADPALLRQVFVNLLSNAVKFTSTRPRRLLEVRGRREAGRVIYDISDNGVGFDMRYASKLFGVFQRLHGREFEGTGVGLALVERIVSRHGGTVAARGEVGVGATFTLSFPDEGASE